MAVYPPRMAPFGLKLRENAFQMIPDISFFGVEQKFGKSFRQQKLKYHEIVCRKNLIITMI